MNLDGKVTLGVVGDVMVGGRALEALRRMGAGLMARLVWAPLQGVDVVVVNLEAPITDRDQVREDKRYNFRSTPEILGLFDGRFVLGLANNHILDYGERGLLDTLEALNDRGVAHGGAGRNLNAARQPAKVKVGGVSLAVLCAADARSQAATQVSAGVFPARPELLRESIRDVRNQVDEVVVSIHAGTEFLAVPSPFQLRLAELCLEEGARVVTFHHTHCIGGIEQSDRGVVLYGTGNYMFPKGPGAPFAAWNEGAAWRVELPASRQERPRIEIEPVLLNHDGLPERATGGQAQEIVRRVEQHSQRLRRRRCLAWWRLSELLKPEYLWLSVVHYSDIARRQGVWRMLKTLARGAQAQLR